MSFMLIITPYVSILFTHFLYLFVTKLLYYFKWKHKILIFYSHKSNFYKYSKDCWSFLSLLLVRAYLYIYLNIQSFFSSFLGKNTRSRKLPSVLIYTPIIISFIIRPEYKNSVVVNIR